MAIEYAKMRVVAGLRTRFGFEAGDDLYKCPGCGCVETIDDYDCCGLDDGDLFCNYCGTIDEMEHIENPLDKEPTP